MEIFNFAMPYDHGADILPVTYYQIQCPIYCTFKIKETTNMHLCGMHIGGFQSCGYEIIVLSYT